MANGEYAEKKGFCLWVLDQNPRHLIKKYKGKLENGFQDTNKWWKWWCGPKHMNMQQEVGKSQDTIEDVFLCSV